MMKRKELHRTGVAGRNIVCLIMSDAIYHKTGTLTINKEDEKGAGRGAEASAAADEKPPGAAYAAGVYLFRKMWYLSE